jgi:deoxycytidylate deaminase
MFHAKAAALRSADLSRQVGAVIMTNHGEIISAGCNEVPKAGGGAVWEGNPEDANVDYRDFQVGHDASARMKHEIISEIFQLMRSNGWLSEEFSQKNSSQLVDEAIYSSDNPILKEARVANIIEFGRIVHAEMSAITEAARRGIGINNQTLYCTTFPCHMCARHIIASGLRRVVYIEPYPKSMAKELYERSISVDDDDADNNSIKFQPFIGVSPRKYIALFERGKRKDKKGYCLEWNAASAVAKFTDMFVTYVEAETIHVAFLSDNKDKLGMDSSTGSQQEENDDPGLVGTTDGRGEKAS